MSIDDEQELRQRLDSVLEAITPSPAPVPATLRRGRTIRFRRRVGVVAGLAAAVGVALAAPGLVHQIIRQAPVTPVPHKWVLTVYPPGPHPSKGEIAWGTVNGKRWQINVTSGTVPGDLCFELNRQDPSCGSPPSSPDQSDPVSFVGSADYKGVDYMYGAVRPDVARVVIALADGTRLTLHPYPGLRQRWVAFPVPADVAIASATVYSKRSELAYAVPQGDNFVAWLRPGERGLPRATYPIASGVLDGVHWSVVVYVGPWGTCAIIAQRGSTGGGCDPAQSLAATGNASFGGAGTPTGGTIIDGTASPSVAYVVGTLSDGRTIRARAVDIGGPRYWACAVPVRQRLQKVVFYTASGQQVAVQSGADYS